MPAPDGTLVVLAKAPVVGRAKTRLAPRYGACGAALLAAAALQDTLDAVAAAPARRRVLALDGDLDAAAAPVAVPAGFEVVPQVPGTHAERIAAALARCTGPTLLVGMDTPQLTSALLDLAGPGDAWLGPARDGGWWALGLRDSARFAAPALAGIPMSTPYTGVAQHRRLRDLGLSVTRLPMLRDVDEPADAAAVAGLAPRTRFAAVHRELRGVPLRLVPATAAAR
jgi:uncharacterized protein